LRYQCKLSAVVVLTVGIYVQAQDNSGTTFSPKPKLHVVGTAHLDTQWRWSILETINKFVPATFRDNFKLMDQYPDYVFGFEGAFRYMLLKEYYPEEYSRLKGYIDRGQWRVVGSWVDAVDVNIPSFESLVRQTLYGNGYFKREFGKTSRDIFLPDCFGFGYALPSIANHCGLKSFSTQKLEWGCWVGIPFDIGIWEGVDGSQLVCALNPGSYVSRIEEDLSRDTTWLNTALRQGEKSGLYAAYRYFGTGDTGGAPDSASVDWLHKSILSDGPLSVTSVGADDLSDLVASTDRSRLPFFKGELAMTRHGVGCYTSQGAMKRWNRKNELLADAAERASVLAHRLGALSYPREELRDMWIQILWHQFHDDVTGTSIPEAYEFSWNDEILAQNRFASMLEHAVASTAPALDTRSEGMPLIVYNPLSIEREDVVEATIVAGNSKTPYVRVFDPSGREVPSDVLESNADSLHICFLARVPSVGYAVFDVRRSTTPCTFQTGLKVTANTLENQRYRVAVNNDGDVESIIDKDSKEELLQSPIRFEFLPDTPLRWPAWEIDYDDISATPNSLWVGPAAIRIKENGCARTAIEIERKTAKSAFKTTLRLAAGGASERLEFENDIDWYEREMMLKVAVSANSGNDSATYDLGLGNIKRGPNQEKLYEVPGHQWADLTALDNSYGVAILNDCKYGWDHPNPEKLRLTLIHTPGIAEGWDWVGDQRSMDNGRHRFTFAIQGHNGDWQQGNVIWQAARLNQPLRAFQTSSHKGSLGKSYSMLEVIDDDSANDHSSVMVNAVKLAEESDEMVIRIRELNGETHQNFAIAFDRPVLTAREINGVEEEIGPGQITNGQLGFSLTPYQPKAFAVTLEAPLKKPLTLPACEVINLPYNHDGISLDDNRCDGDFDGKGNSLAGELLPDTIMYNDVPFVLGQKNPGAFNAVVCANQTIELPRGKYNRLYLLAAATNGPAMAQFSIGARTFTTPVQDYSDPVGQWNNRLVGGAFFEDAKDIAPAYINRMPVAWYGSHHHTAACENDPYKFSYLFPIVIELMPKDQTVSLPSNPNIKLLAATLVNTPYDETRPAQPLFDVTNSTLVRLSTDSVAFAYTSTITLSSPVPNTNIYYTLDGSEPTGNSLRYSKPITVNSTSTIKARGINPEKDDHYVASMSVNQIGLYEPIKVEDVFPGLACKYYEGEWESLPNFDTMAVAKSLVADTVSIPEFARDEDYGLTFKGVIKVPIDGVYAFSINSDDGSRLFVADSLVVDNDGLHGDSEITGLIGLKSGYHSISAYMFQCKGGEALGMSIAGPSLAKQIVSVSMLYHGKDL